MDTAEEYELVRETWAAFSRADLDAMLEKLHPEIEIVPFGAALESRSYSGREGVRRWFSEELTTAWERFETIPEDYRKVGDQLVVYGHWSAAARSTGVEIEMPATWVIEVRDGADLPLGDVHRPRRGAPQGGPGVAAGGLAGLPRWQMSWTSRHRRPRQGHAMA